jgi:hypothetical protein
MGSEDEDGGDVGGDEPLISTGDGDECDLTRVNIVADDELEAHIWEFER